ncbi:CS1 type fimbrial major subunit [Pseudomonas rubra]|uniref:Fimbrial protein n=1 Tax=Pseudomonas rubra TaxID=2942627 RepID=A0ABT5P2A6_9PSED|nr:CS1 type fimbrial major subunit [Pseudomonas rubra]MDD1012402.1 fimbrial protein [Pseudomonas rubra]MDD1037251.1 fimbrial protein [Pseudomonas rubra]MDD1152968.1 fimbrial protein [Pseudomonas rubra]
MNKFTLAAPFALLALSISAQAADPIQHQVTVVATVPTDSFYVVTPPGDNWTNDPQTLPWNHVREDFDSLSKQFDVKSTIGPISASLTSPASIASGGNQIGLNVMVGGVQLSPGTPEVVVPAAAAAGGTRIEFRLAANTPSGGYVPGNYQGMVGMMFETAAP